MPRKLKEKKKFGRGNVPRKGKEKKKIGKGNVQVHMGIFVH